MVPLQEDGSVKLRWDSVGPAHYLLSHEFQDFGVYVFVRIPQELHLQVSIMNNDQKRLQLILQYAPPVTHNIWL
jgi:hypothetical protein